MRMNAEGLELLKGFEGLRTRLYNDIAGYATIGYGHLVHKSEVGLRTELEKYFRTPITEELASALLRVDVMTAEYAVNKFLAVKVTQTEFNALVSFTFNVGMSAFKNSTLLSVINDFYEHMPKDKMNEKVAEQLRRWKYANKKISQGLVNRREKEIKMWLGD